MQSFLLLVGGLVLALATVKLLSLLLIRRSTETLSFRGPVRAVEIDLDAGEVTVRGTGRSDARVRRTIRRGLRRPRITEAVDDGVLRLHVTAGVVTYEIDVPRSAAVVVRGDAASATVIGVAGFVELQAEDGSIEGRALGGSAVRATTTAGSIRLSFDRVPDRVDATTHRGSVDLALPSGPYDVDVSCGRGQGRIGVANTPGARCHVSAHSSAGHVRIDPR
jgi:hypothetical protein